MNGRPKVSVVTITYNQVAYIAETLEGFVAQQTDFPVEFIVADDASSDGTAEIVASYAERRPDLFVPILRPTNVGIGRNLVGALSQARGDYLALCEGDDYWTDPTKLAQQAAHLDAHPGTAVCFHPVEIVRDDGQPKGREFPPVDWRDDLSLDRLLDRNFIQTNSVMYRSLSPTDYAQVPVDILPLDHYLHVLHARTGAIDLLPTPMAAYRHHEGGVWWDGKSGNMAGHWARHAGSVVRGRQALLDLFGDDRAREEHVVRLVAKTFATIARDTADAPDSPLADAVRTHPELATRAVAELARQLATAEAERKRGRKEVQQLKARVSKLRKRLDEQPSLAPRASLMGRLKKGAARNGSQQP